MVVFKCKMCGADLNVSDDVRIAMCEYCGSTQTLPTLDNEKKLGLFARANKLRAACEFDKAAGVYESIVAEFPDESEGYWGLILCNYGIEYVDDPATGKKIPTCHRSSFESVLDCNDFEMVMENSDGDSRKVYRDEAKEIEALRKAIVEISNKEAPYDIFICYKETDKNGDRTIDSVIAQDVYNELTEKGYRVFFSRITLEDKLGHEYEPYIFAALNSAKIMLAFGTDYEHYNAVWVKNEWSRFLHLIEKGAKKTLIPCYKSIDAYDMPKEFSKLQAQDMGKVGAVQDLLRGIEKIIGRNPVAANVQDASPSSSAANATVDSLLSRAFLFLEDGKWQEADAYCEKVLDIDSKNAKAYLGKLLCNLNIKTPEGLKDREGPFHNNENYKKIERFGDEEIKAQLRGYIDFINERNNTKKKEEKYLSARNILENNKDDKASLESVKGIFIELGDFRDSKELLAVCQEEIRLLPDKAKYKEALKIMQDDDSGEEQLNEAICKFRELGDFRDSKALIEKCKALIEELPMHNDYKEAVCNYNKSDELWIMHAKQIFEELGDYKDSEEYVKKCEQKLDSIEKKSIRSAKRAAVIILIVFVLIVGFFVFVMRPAIEYNNATNLMKAEKYDRAIEVFEKTGDYKNSAELIMECKFQIGVNLMNAGNNEEALLVFEEMRDYGDALEYIDECNRNIELIKALALMDEGKYDEAYVIFERIGDQEYINACREEIDYADAVELLNAGKYEEAIVVFNNNLLFKNSAEYLDKCNEAIYDCAETLLSEGKTVEAAKMFAKCIDYTDAWERSFELWQDISDIAVSADSYHIAGVKNDGTVIAVGSNHSGQCNVSGWRNVVKVCTGTYFTVGLKSNGTVVATGSNDDGQCNVYGWTDIVAISVSDYHTVGLKSDGTVVAVGSNSNGQLDVDDWTDIVAISAGTSYTLGLKRDGTVVAVGDNSGGQLNVDDWTDIVAISAGTDNSMGLKKDGTVISTDGGYNRVEKVVFIYSTALDSYMLTSDGRVLRNSYNNDIKENAIAILPGYELFVSEDGTFYNYDFKGKCDLTTGRVIELSED